MPTNLAEEDFIKTDWTLSPALKFDEEDDRTQARQAKLRELFGDDFEENLRYDMVVRNLKKNKHPETGKERVDLEAECIGGAGKAVEYTGKTLKTSFFFPLTSELQGLDEDALRKKTYHSRLFNSFVAACGHPEQDKVNGVVPLNKMVGDKFSFEAGHWLRTGKPYRRVVNGEIINGKYDDQRVVQISKVFPCGNTPTLPVQPNIAQASTTSDVPEVATSNATEQDFAEEDFTDF